MEKKVFYFETTSIHSLKVKATACAPYLEEKIPHKNMHKICTKLK